MNAVSQVLVPSPLREDRVPAPATSPVETAWEPSPEQEALLVLLAAAKCGRVSQGCLWSYGRGCTLGLLSLILC